MFLLFIIASALLQGIADVLYFKFDQSIFASMSNTNFWNPALSVNKKKFLFFRWDAVNIFKALAVWIWIIGIVVAPFRFFQIYFIPTIWLLPMAIIVYILSYNIGYHRLFIKKTPVV